MELTFKNNLVARIDVIEQWRTYAGLLEGLPTRQMNQRILKGLPIQAQKKMGINATFLIEPTQKAIEYEGEYPFGEPFALPKITCIALLHYSRAVRVEEMDYSELILIWFQDEFAFPIEEAILAKIKEVDWTQVAQDLEW